LNAPGVHRSIRQVEPISSRCEMRIGLNLLHALPDIGGGWNYVQNLVAALGECDATNSYVAFVTRESECLVPTKPNFEPVRINTNSVRRPQRVIYENTMLQILAVKHELDCMHWFGNTQALFNTVPGVVTIYDLHAFLDSSRFPVVKRVYLRLMMTLTARRAAMLLPISQATAQELQSVLHADPTRMVVIPVVLGPQFEPVAAERIVRFRIRYGLPDRFWLYVAHQYPHKNHIRLLHAYHRLKSNGLTPWSLVLRGDPKGAEAEVIDTVAHLNLRREVIILPRLDEADLPVLYSAAAALVFPSLYEGGGIPVVEAMACGCPVTASNIPAVKEFAGDAALYFDPLDIGAIGQAMLAFQQKPANRECYVRRGLRQAGNFRAQSIIGKLLNAYKQGAAR
jgi:glycosyltransferase involved in cell wall biosynthesis